MSEVYHSHEQPVQLPLFVTSKVCSCCKREQAFDCFHVDRSRKDGLCRYCKECSQSKHKAQYENNPRRTKRTIRHASDGHKVCSKCLVEKPLDAFYKDPRYTCGLKTECKECISKRRRQWSQVSLAPDFKACTKCGIEKPIDEFYKSSAGKGGYRSACKECCDIQRGHKEPGKRRNVRDIAPGYKWCYSCQREKPLEAFHRDSSKKDGCHSLCVDCFQTAQHERYKAHPIVQTDEMRAYRRKWEQTHRVQRIERYRHYFARRRRLSNGRVSYQRILERDGYHCYICEKAIAPHDLSFDHVIPLTPRAGNPQGTHTADNIKTCHKICNSRKVNKRFEDLTPWDRRGPDTP